MRLTFKPYIDTIRPYEPGKPLEEVQRELGLKRVVKLASNENPLGPSPKAIRAIRRFGRRVSLYPDGGVFYLKEKLADTLGVSRDQLVIGNGSNEIIEFLVKGFVREGERVISSATSFLVYPLVTRTLGGEFVEVPMQDFRYDLEGMAAKMDERTRLVFIANPNNPTGTYVTKKEVGRFLEKVPPTVVVCFDEAYFEFVEADDFPEVLTYVKEGRTQVVVLRTFSKSYGLAGLRIGYGVAAAPVVAYLNKIRQPFNVNSVAQTAALAALEDESFLERTKKIVQEGKRYLYREFEKLGIRYLKSQANFILADTGFDGEQVFRLLLRRGVIVRSMKPYRLETHIRVTVGREGENQKFIRELKRVLKELEQERLG